MHDELALELRCLKEQHEAERGQLLASGVEVQILRERVVRLQGELAGTREKLLKQE